MGSLPIPFEEIAVIVRGLVIGSDDTEESKKFTKRALQSVRKHLPGARVILSTWRDSNVAKLDYDELVLGDPPLMIYTIVPDGRRFANSTNHQILSIQNGLAKANRKYTLVMRSDIVLTHNGFLKYFADFNQGKGEDILKEKVLVLPAFNAKKPIRFKLLFNTCDWFYFGLTEDIKNIFDIPMMDESKLRGEKVNGHYQQAENFGTEQYIWVNFLKKYKDFYFPNGYYFSEEAFRISEESYAKNTIMVPARRAGVLCLKMPHAAYGANPILSSGLYTFNEYKKLHNEYNSTKVPYVPNPFEEMVYSILLITRSLASRIFPAFYKKSVNFLRKLRGSNDLLR